MDNIEKSLSLFRYIKELYAQRIQVVSNIKDQQWHKFLNEIPVDIENICLNYFDKTEEEVYSDSNIILQVKKPDFERCPELPHQIDGWVNNGWDDFHNEVSLIKEHKSYINGVEKVEEFVNDLNRVTEFKKWRPKRQAWADRQKQIEKKRNFYNELYHLYIDLERDAETFELMVGQGLLKCQNDGIVSCTHPILLKRISLNFDSKNKVFTVIDTESSPEIYTMVLQEINFINHSSIKLLKEELSENLYHPLDRNDTIDYLKSFGHRMHSDSEFINELDKEPNPESKVIMYNNPVLFVRKRTGGVIKALDDIIEQIAETNYLSGPLLNLIGENASQFAESIETVDLTKSLAAISGEDRDILLSKEANKEQLDIARQIENYNAVLVQGPPGTGKTHTIANLVGHFLSQGKNILVTSHTRKALAVVKDKVAPELQSLCVSILDDNNKDMERSVDGITEYISAHSSIQLNEEAFALKERREKLIADLEDVRKDLYTIKHKEYESIVFGGKGYSVSESARFVSDNQEELCYIPGKVELYNSLPVSVADLELLYMTNSEISANDEMELKSNLPNPKDLMNPNEFASLIEQKNYVLAKIKSLYAQLDEYINIDFNDYRVTIKGEALATNFDVEKANELLGYLKSHSNSEYSKWELNAMLAGKQGVGFKKVWEDLIQLISNTYEYSGNVVSISLGNKVEIAEALIHEKNISILEMIKAHLLKGKKLKGLDLLLNKEWKPIISNIRINNSELATARDCEIVIADMELRIKRLELENIWNELIGKNGGPLFNEFGAQPEQSCMSYLPKIDFCVKWYSDTFSEVKAKIIGCGFTENCLNSDKTYINPIDEVEYIGKQVYQTTPKLINLMELIKKELAEIQSNIGNMNNVLEQNEGTSDICRNIAIDLQTEDITSYKANYLVLEDLYKKYHYLKERARILNEIEKVAPEWAKSVETRIGIHGENKVPSDIEDAWKWKQFAGIVDKITKEPFEELQYKSVHLNRELRKSTAKLAENLAWYHLLTRIEGDVSQKQALQGWKLTTKKIGKGTGKTAPMLKREAQKLMAKCQSAVPAWIMPINKALENLDPKENKFDIVIIDEASQSDISALAIMYLAKKIIIVGDDEQVSPSAVGLDVERMANLAEMFIKDIIPNSHLYDMKSSLYDIAKTTFPTLMLKEHFRCVPNIIGYSNRLSYDYKIKPLREDSDVPIKPATISYRVDGQRGNRKTNEIEAKNIVALMKACMEQPEYNDMTFGAISLLGDEQAKYINNLAIEKIDPEVYEKRKILCGSAPHFQGDERDVIFLSLVDSNEGDGPLRMTGEGIGKSTKQRYNVAASRARNQLWVVHSLDVNNDLKSGDMRKDLIDYVTNPIAFEQRKQEIIKKADSPFEISVANSLVKNGYHIVQQWPVGSYRIDMVAIFGDRKVAIECDGELYHSGDDKVRKDMERQAILERLGWKFIRIRGSEYYRNSEKTMERVIRELTDLDIFPEQNIEVSNDKFNELQQRIFATAERIIEEWDNVEV